MIDLRLISDKELADLMKNQTNIDYQGLNRRGLISELENLKECGKPAPIDSYYILDSRLTRLRRFKELQEEQLRQFIDILKKY